MEIQIRHDATIPGNENLADRVRATIEGALERYADRITTIQAHLADENGPKRGGDEYRCAIEVHVKGRKPIAVTHKDTTFELAVEMAADKMARMLDSQLEKQRDDRQPLNAEKPTA
jgi:ribosomal subunit interface protein